MSRLSPVSFSELVRKLKSLDFEGPFSGGKHLFMIKGDLGLLSLILIGRILELIS